MALSSLTPFFSMACLISLLPPLAHGLPAALAALAARQTPHYGQAPNTVAGRPKMMYIGIGIGVGVLGLAAAVSGWYMHATKHKREESNHQIAEDQYELEQHKFEQETGLPAPDHHDVSSLSGGGGGGGGGALAAPAPARTIGSSGGGGGGGGGNAAEPYAMSVPARGAAAAASRQSLAPISSNDYALSRISTSDPNRRRLRTPNSARSTSGELGRAIQNVIDRVRTRSPAGGRMSSETYV